MTTTDTDRWTSEARAIVRCTRKGCKRAHVTEFATTTITRAWEGRMAQSRTVHVRGRDIIYRDRYDLARIVCRDFTCAGCGGTGCTFDVIKGSFSEAVKCGAKCRNAVGPTCDCQCGGENHASGHAAI